MIGIDLIEIARIAQFADRYGASGLKRFLNDNEFTRAKKAETIAGIWAAKEAVAKALGCGIGGELGFHDITIEKSANGAPRAVLSPKAATRHGIKRLALSITHEKRYAVAVAMRLLV
ncbi:MAG: holo-ACP synthase [Helicobacteraceae bacterium]|jgi:holo-[acyl-carrier protein] synthase|nr:holo-ACP synthase [Helicobacteraceae bacterium]